MQDSITQKLEEAYKELIFVKDCRVAEQNFAAASAYRDLGNDLKKFIERAKVAAQIQPPSQARDMIDCYQKEKKEITLPK